MHILSRAGVRKEEGRAKAGDQANSHVDEKLDEQKHAVYRAIVARANYLAPDRPDIAFAAKDLARSMSSPCRGDWDRLKRLARYLKGKPRVVKKYRWQKPMSTFSIFSDADWAGDKQSRKSTSGGCIMVGKHLSKGWAETQTLVALSSGESEFDSVACSCAVGSWHVTDEVSIVLGCLLNEEPFGASV